MDVGDEFTEHDIKAADIAVREYQFRAWFRADVIPNWGWAMETWPDHVQHAMLLAHKPRIERRLLMSFFINNGMEAKVASQVVRVTDVTTDRSGTYVCRLGGYDANAKADLIGLARKLSDPHHAFNKTDKWFNLNENRPVNG